MKILVVDACVLISALIKGEHILSKLVGLKELGIRIVVPTYVFEEIEEKRDKILEYSAFSPEHRERILDFFNETLERFDIIRFEWLKEFIEQSEQICSDKDDIPYVALSLAFGKAPVWYFDEELREDCEKVGIKVFSKFEDILREFIV